MMISGQLPHQRIGDLGRALRRKVVAILFEVVAHIPPLGYRRIDGALQASSLP